MLATIRRPASTRPDPQTEEALDRVEQAYDLDDAAIDDLTASHGPEIRKITSALNRMQLDPEHKLVLSRPRIYAHYLLQHFQDVTDSEPRSAKASAEAVASRATEAVERFKQQGAELRGQDQDRDRRPPPARDQRRGRDRDQADDRYPARAGGGRQGLPYRICPEPNLVCDPLPCAVSGLVDLEGDPADSVLELDFDPLAVHAVKHLAHTVAFGEQLGVFPAFDALLSQWDDGAWLFTRDDLNDALYCMLRRDSRMTQRDRHELAAAVLGVRSDDLPPGARVNTGFPLALQQLVQEILRVQEAECACERLDVASRASVVFAVDQLRFNINANVSGAALMRIRELVLDLDTVQSLLVDTEVINQVACGHRDGVLAVVNILNGRDPSVTPNAVAISRADEARTALLTLVADTYVDFDDDDTFDDAVEAATTLDAAEAFLTGRPRAAQAELIRPGDGRYRVTGMAPQAAIPDRSA